MIGDSRINFVVFTGSVDGGRQIEHAAAGRFIGVGTELGGKDPSYVRTDADLAYSIAENVDGVFSTAVSRVVQSNEFMRTQMSTTSSLMVSLPRRSLMY